MPSFSLKKKKKKTEIYQQDDKSHCPPHRVKRQFQGLLTEEWPPAGRRPPRAAPEPLHRNSGPQGPPQGAVPSDTNPVVSRQDVGLREVVPHSVGSAGEGCDVEGDFGVLGGAVPTLVVPKRGPRGR